MLKLLAATHNKGKLLEIKALLADLPIEVLSPAQINLDLVVQEDGKTYKENATKKALAFSKATDLLTLADDSGLEVDVINGQPGLYSARFANNTNATDADRRAYLLEKLKHHPKPWLAKFRCVVALHDPESGLYHSEGVCRGSIISEERGHRGFGYDPIFLVEGTRRTMAELTLEEKNLLSHRARAVIGIKPTIEGMTTRCNGGKQLNL